MTINTFKHQSRAADNAELLSGFSRLLHSLEVGCERQCIGAIWNWQLWGPWLLRVGRAAACLWRMLFPALFSQVSH